MSPLGPARSCSGPPGASCSRGDWGAAQRPAHQKPGVPEVTSGSRVGGEPYRRCSAASAGGKLVVLIAQVAPVARTQPRNQLPVRAAADLPGCRCSPDRARRCARFAPAATQFRLLLSNRTRLHAWRRRRCVCAGASCTPFTCCCHVSSLQDCFVLSHAETFGNNLPNALMKTQEQITVSKSL